MSGGQEAEEFLRRWLGFVEHHAATPASARRELVERVLAEGLPQDIGPAQGRVATAARLQAERDLIRASGWFDPVGYFWHNPDLSWDLCGHEEELRHFTEKGWRELRHPVPQFDVWSYWCDNLDPSSEELNPLVHYLVEGRRAGLDTAPAVHTRPSPEAPASGRPPRRICLFAAYDVDGVVDQTVVDYVAELSRFADVYYLADCEMAPEELDKLSPWTRGRWAVRHGRYDFGSYSMLARDLVGWDLVDQYDELLLVNDSCYLVQPLDQVFDRMDATPCDWWGLQATYEHFGVHEYEALGRPLVIEEMEEEMRRLDLWRYSDFVHVGSYFVAFRREVHRDPAFRRRLDQVSAQSDKARIILKYEIGFSRLLVLAGYHLATFVDGVLPYHPVYRESAFELLGEGFPLLKRQFLYENPFERPDLERWKERVLERVPDADVAAMEHNLHRVAPAWTLARSFAVHTDDDGRVVRPPAIGPDNFAEEEAQVPHHHHWWVFPVDPRTGSLSGNLRAVLEAVKDDGGVKKIVMHGGRRPRVTGGQNVVVVAADSVPGQMYAMRAGVVFTTVGPRADLPHPLSHRIHRFVALGDPRAVALPEDPLDTAEQHDVDLTRLVVVDSEEARARAAARYPHLRRHEIRVLGTPRQDLLQAPEHQLTDDLRDQLERVRAAVDGRALVVVSATTRAGQAALSESATALQTSLGDHVAVGLRPWLDPAREDSDESGVPPEPFVDLSILACPDVEMAWRLADVVVSDSPVDLADVPAAGAIGVRLDTPDLPETVRRALGQRRERPRDSHPRVGRRVVRALKEAYLPIDEWLTGTEGT